MHGNDVITSGYSKKRGCLINYELSGWHSWKNERKILLVENLHENHVHWSLSAPLLILCVLKSVILLTNVILCTLFITAMFWSEEKQKYSQLFGLNQRLHTLAYQIDAPSSINFPFFAPPIATLYPTPLSENLHIYPFPIPSTPSIKN